MTSSLALLHYQHFEICSDYLRDSEDRLASSAIVVFLLSFRDLRPTLHGLVFHERRLMPIDAERIFEDLRDVNMASPNIPQILRHSSPAALGLCLRPAGARSLLLGIPERSSIKLLHFHLKPARKRSEAQDFVLLILAFGDFSHDDHYSEQQILIRRKKINEQPYPRVSSEKECSIISSCFCLVDSDDRSLWDGLPLDGTGFLSACPGTGLMDSPYDL
ncbi:hypothetical protein BO71DRAFT_450620 [Aspergillus ellipticus CBS 707.79]|uniref:Uncharacterized protein n=1 Tax=Aspergillus ellipticus CBS 707.79 TaxID=1448320 RepID=A0A319D808_9EURO|nr:hypothetical protein BO71DRAFT_450620 [Aspergillus ellipticus CBS 707.79]